MAEIVVAANPFAGHVGPMRALVAELRARGHVVRSYTGSRYRARLADGGAAIAWDEAVDFDELELHRAFPRLRRGSGPLQTFSNLEHVFIRNAEGQARDLLRAHAERPWDVLVAETTLLGAGIAAELTGTPWASVSLTPLQTPSHELPPPGLAIRPAHGPLGRARDAALRATSPVLVAPLDRAYRQVRRSLGADDGPRLFRTGWDSPWLALANGVAALELPRGDLPDTVHFIGRLAAPPPRDRRLPGWWPDVAVDARPLVHVTQGTLDVDHDALLRPALEGLADEPVLVVATTGTDAAALGPVPPNARTVDLLPYEVLLPRAEVMVTNGGWGGILEALSRGVPLVVAGGTIDKPENAMRVAVSGAGIDLRTGRPTPTAIREAVRRVRGEPRFREAAAGLAAEFARHGGAGEASELIERLARTGSPVRRTERAWPAEAR